MAEVTTHFFLVLELNTPFLRCFNPPVSRASGVRGPSCLAFPPHRDPFTETGRAVFVFLLLLFISHLSSFQSMMHENESCLATCWSRGRGGRAFRPGGGKSEIQKKKTQNGSVKVPFNVDRFGENFICNFWKRRLGGRFLKSPDSGTGADCPLCRRQLLSPAEKELQFSPRLRDRYASSRQLAIEADCCFIQAAADDTCSDGLRRSRGRASFYRNCKRHS